MKELHLGYARQAGRTSDLVLRASALKARILCPDKERVKQICRLAHKLGVKIKKPISSEELREMDGIKKVTINEWIVKE